MNTTEHPLPTPAGNVQALCGHLSKVLHAATHARAGRHRLGHLQLQLPQAWRSHRASLQAAMCTLLAHWAQASVKAEVVLLSAIDQPRLHLTWTTWRGPNLSSNLDPISHPTTTEPPMNLFNLFKASQPAAPSPLPDPRVEPRSAAVPSEGISDVFKPVLEHVIATEITDLSAAGIKGTFRLDEIEFTVRPANQLALARLMALNEKHPAAARTLLATARAACARPAALDVTTTALRFRHADTLPSDAEVLMVTGRDKVSLPFTYKGEFLFAGDPAPGNTANDASASPRSAVNAVKLHVWLPSAGAPRQFTLDVATVIGADPDRAQLLIDHPHVSGAHVCLRLDVNGWTALDELSTNGTALFDASSPASPGNPPLQTLPRGQTVLLPLCGSLFLGRAATAPVLHFSQTGQRSAGPQPTAATQGSRRRVTELGPKPGAAV